MNRKTTRQEYHRKYYRKHRKELIKRARAWSLANPEKVRKSKRNWHKKWYRKNKEKVKKYVANYKRTHPNHWKTADPIKLKARNILWSAVRYGKIKRPKQCSRCHKKCTPHGHHPDYSKPLKVIWLCEDCHNEEHDKHRN